MTILFSWKMVGFLSMAEGKTTISILPFRSSKLTKSIGFPERVMIFLIPEIIPPILTLTFLLLI